MPSSKLFLNSVKKHSVRYDADPDDERPVMTSAYISKTALPEPFPKGIVISVAWPGGES